MTYIYITIGIIVLALTILLAIVWKMFREVDHQMDIIADTAQKLIDIDRK